jgi:hypothetical protein
MVLDSDESKMNARFATTEDTARALGVPLSRARKLAKLVDSYRSFKSAGISKAGLRGAFSASL